jgi:aspartate racemase
MYSFDFSEVEDLQNAGDWDRLTKIMVQEARNLKSAGAQFIVICTNTMHLMSDAIEKETGLEVLHIAEATANEIVKRRVEKVLLLGTKFTMEGDFYKNRLSNHDIQVVIPSESDREIVHKIIYEELVCGIISDESKEAYKSIINSNFPHQKQL